MQQSFEIELRILHQALENMSFGAATEKLKVTGSVNFGLQLLDT